MAGLTSDRSRVSLGSFLILNSSSLFSGIWCVSNLPPLNLFLAILFCPGAGYQSFSRPGLPTISL